MRNVGNKNQKGKELFIANFEFKSETEIIERTLFDELNNRRRRDSDVYRVEKFFLFSESIRTRC